MKQRLRDPLIISTGVAVAALIVVPVLIEISSGEGATALSIAVVYFAAPALAVVAVMRMQLPRSAGRRRAIAGAFALACLVAAAFCAVVLGSATASRDSTPLIQLVLAGLVLLAALVLSVRAAWANLACAFTGRSFGSGVRWFRTELCVAVCLYAVLVSAVTGIVGLAVGLPFAVMALIAVSRMPSAS